MGWKPRAEYQTLRDSHAPVLTRSKWTGPVVVIYSEHGPTPGGHFYPCPGVPIFYGANKFGMMLHDSFDEWMEIPE